mgnify:CR=1 FL=1
MSVEPTGTYLAILITGGTDILNGFNDVSILTVRTVDGGHASDIFKN